MYWLWRYANVHCQLDARQCCVVIKCSQDWKRNRKLLLIFVLVQHAVRPTHKSEVSHYVNNYLNINSEGRHNKDCTAMYLASAIKTKSVGRVLKLFRKIFQRHWPCLRIFVSDPVCPSPDWNCQWCPSGARIAYIRAMFEHRCFPKKRLSTHTMHLTWHHRNLS